MYTILSHPIVQGFFGKYVKQINEGGMAGVFIYGCILALLFAVLFTSVQSYGLWAFMRSTRDYQNPQLNTHGFVFMFAALHAMHFVVAQSVLLWVTLSAFLDRYDHEYYWGVTVCTYFWHLLGIVWLGLLAVFGITM